MMPAPEVELPQLQKPLAPAQPDVEYQWEILSKIAGEMWPLIQEKSKETFPEHDVRPPDPDWETYAILECENRLHIITARVEEKLVGYAVWQTSRNLHRKTEMVAIGDTYYVKAEYRAGHGIGRRLFKESFARLHEMGCRDILPYTNEEFSASHDGLMDRFFASLGCKPFSMVYILQE